MTLVQISFGELSGPASGADLRNRAIVEAAGSRWVAHSLPLASLPGYRDGHVSVSPVKTVLRIDEATRQSLIEELKRLDPDVALVESIALLPLVRAIRSCLPSIKIVIDFHNLESALLREKDGSRLPSWMRPLAPPIFHQRWEGARAAEVEAYQIADAIWCCSESDHDAVKRQCCLLPVRVVPNPIPPGCEPLPPAGNGEVRKILFAGHLGYRPNALAGVFAVTRILPLLKKEIDGCQLILAGRSPSARLEKTCLGHPGVRLCPNPASMRPFYEESDLVILPLFEGGGTRIKVLEAAAFGRPIVATEKAVEGLDLEPGRHYLQAESATGFAKHIAFLFRNPAMAQELVASAGTHLLERHGPEAIQRAVSHALRDLG